MEAKKNNDPRYRGSVIKSMVRRPSYLLYTALFYLASAFGFFTVTMLGGSSNIAGTANYSILALLVIVPLLMIGNDVRVRENGSEFDAVMGKWLQHIAVFFVGLLIYIPFAIIIAGLGTFRAPLFLNGVLNVALFGIAYISFAMLMTTVSSRRKIGYICVYAIALILVVIELVIGRPGNSESVLHKILYSVSVSKLTYCMRIGILDWKTMLLYLLVAALSLCVTVHIVKRRNGGGKLTVTKAIVPGALLAAMLVTAFTPGGAVTGADMTPAKFFTLGNTAKEYAGTVDRDITVTVADSRSGFIDKYDYSTYFLQAERIINQIGAENDRITVKYDPKAEAAAGDVIVSGGEKTEIIKSSELFNFGYTYDEDGTTHAQVASSRVEEALCSAINDVSDDTGHQVAFLLNGSENENYKNLASLMEGRGYEIEYVDVNAEEIPDVKLAVIFAPAEDYAGTVALENYMYNGGEYGRNLLYVANSDASLMLTNLTSFLSRWGVAVENYNVVETDTEACLNGNAFYGMNEYIEYDFISDYTYLENPAVVPYSRNIVTDDENTDMTYRTLLQSKETSCLTNRNTLIDRQGNYNTAIIASYYQENLFGTGYTGVTANVGIIGSEKAFDTDVLGSGEYSNASYFADVMDELAGKNDVSVPISARTLTLAGVEASTGQRAAVGITLMAVLPMAILALAVIAFVKNKKEHK